jgi:hypothetical protein
MKVMISELRERERGDEVTAMGITDDELVRLYRDGRDCDDCDGFLRYGLLCAVMVIVDAIGRG